MCFVSSTPNYSQLPDVIDAIDAAERDSRLQAIRFFQQTGADAAASHDEQPPEGGSHPRETLGGT